MRALFLALSLAAGSTYAVEPALSAADTLSAVQRVKPVTPQTSGPNVLRAQVLLDRAHFSPGEMDAAYGSNMRQAIRGFQKLRQLPVSGNIDAATWTELERDDAPVLAVYTLTAQDIAGPYAPVPPDMAGKAKLATLGYASLAEALGERFHCSPELLRRLNPGRTMKRAGEQLLVPNVAIIKPLPKAASLLVDAKEGTLTLLDAGGMPFAQFPASTGSQHDPLPQGRWQVRGVATNPEYRYNPKLFWDAKAGDTKARIAAGPNNPVGLAWIDLSIEHYGIHGTPEPGKIGKTQSHGCVRLTNWDVMQVVRAVSRGASVLMQA
ncbi:L,D-transpeptidase family protein [Duganella sp. CY15W]|uniref:L,D-transpeptidase family protein n=1 Tax=Duganella sp. CY15W TaxID=2692172 RepID=UPI00136D81CB|nr:L,D-transpeptidase [Duganella sp. CY15W]MYM26806.1 L,D-transpeptidase family protein [Duganella sp. CY15W]